MYFITFPPLVLVIYDLLYFFLSNNSCWKVHLCKTLAVGLSGLGGCGRTRQQVAEHWEWYLEGVCTFTDLSLYFHNLNQKKLSPTISAHVSHRGQTPPPRPQSATCCRWCTRTLSAGRTPFRRFPVWAGWGRSCSLLLLACCAQRECRSRCTSAPSTATGEARPDRRGKLKWEMSFSVAEYRWKLAYSLLWHNWEAVYCPCGVNQIMNFRGTETLRNPIIVQHGW